MKDFIGEMLGTFVLILFGCSSVAVAVLFNEYNSIFQIGMVWGLAVTLSVFLTRNSIVRLCTYRRLQCG